MRTDSYPRHRTILIILLAFTLLLSQLALYPPIASAASNLAAGKAMSASSFVSPYGPGNANDGNQGSYWESANNAFPQWIAVDLGGLSSITRVTLKLPGNWEARSQTLAIQGSTNGSAYNTIVASSSYTFNPNTGNTVNIDLPSTDTRFVRVYYTANTGWSAGQLSELEVIGTPVTASGMIIIDLRAAC